MDAFSESTRSQNKIFSMPLKRVKLDEPVSRRFLLPIEASQGRELQSSLSDETTFVHEVDNAGNYAYMSNFYIGSNRQEMKLVLDTGSSVMWVQGSECPNPSECTGQSFDSSESITFNALTTTEEITYGVGKIEGYAVKD